MQEHNWLKSQAYHQSRNREPTLLDVTSDSVRCLAANQYMDSILEKAQNQKENTMVANQYMDTVMESVQVKKSLSDKKKLE